MALINPKPRFAYDDATDQVYDYRVQRDIPLTARHVAPDGVWNLFEVKRLILAGQGVEDAWVSAAPKPKAAPPAPKAPAPAPAPAPDGDDGLQSAPSSAAPADPDAGLSAEELKALGLSPLQAAALGLTRSQLDVVGIPASTITAWAITPERADALKLTTVQRMALMRAPAA